MISTSVFASIDKLSWLQYLPHLMMKRHLFLVGLTVTSMILVIGVLTDAFSWLRGPQPDSAVWHWPYLLRPWTQWWPALLAGVGFLLILGWWLRRRNSSGWETAVTLSLLAITIFFLQWGLVYAGNPQPSAELVNRTLAVQTNGYFWTAAHIDDLAATLRHYPDAMPQFESEHAQTHPPGLIIANRATISLMGRWPVLAQRIAQFVRPLRCIDLWLLDQETAVTAALGIWAYLPLIIAAIIVFPAYGLAHMLSKNSSGKLAVTAGIIPSLILFAPLPDQLFSFLTLLVVIVFHRAWHKQKNGAFFLAGLLLSLNTFFSVGNAAILVLLGVYALLKLWIAPVKWPRFLAWAGFFLAGLAIIWLAYWLGWGVPPWKIVQTGIEQHYNLVTSQRDYGIWLGYNLLDLALFTGIPAMTAFILALTAVPNQIRQRTLTDKQQLALSTAVLILLLALSGSTRGEVGRIWLFFMPLLLISGSSYLEEWLPDWRQQWAWAALQITGVFLLGFAWQPMEATIVVAQQPDLPPLPDKATPVDITFAETITLHSYTLTTQPDSLLLTLTWQTNQSVQRPYTVFNHLLNTNGELVAQQDNWPVNGQWPPTCWQPGSLIPDSYVLALPPDLPPGDYHLFTGLYDARDGTRLITANGRDALHLATIKLPAAPTTTTP